MAKPTFKKNRKERTHQEQRVYRQEKRKSERPRIKRVTKE